MLALALGGRSIAEWKASMTQPEFLMWCEFYKQEPFDDRHRYHRPAALLARVMGGGEIGDYLEWLQPTSENSAYSNADLATMAALGVKPPAREST